MNDLSRCFLLDYNGRNSVWIYDYPYHSLNPAQAIERILEGSGKLLFDTAKEILTDPARTKSMRQAASSLAVVDSAQRIYETALELIQSR